MGSREHVSERGSPGPIVGGQHTIERIQGHCALCISRCGSVAVVEDGRFVALEPDPSHPTGSALCAKGRAAPELVYHPDRLLYPLKRTRPKGDPDPGWQRISWDEALDLTAARLRQIAEESGPESVAFSQVSGSTSAIAESQPWIQRLMRAFGSPNMCGSMELCGWGRNAARFTWGTPIGLPGSPMPDIEQAGCILFWGYNPSLSRISHATATVAALKRGARLIVVDPRKAGLASKADVWLQVRPGTDAALALGIANQMLARGWYDRDFVRDWTNGPLLVRTDTGRLLTEADLAGDSVAEGSVKPAGRAQTAGGGQAEGSAQTDGGAQVGRGLRAGGGAQPGSRVQDRGGVPRYVAWDVAADRPLLYDPARRSYLGAGEDVGERDGAEPALFGTHTIATPSGQVTCRTAFDLAAERCSQYSLDAVTEITGVGAEHVTEAARLLWESRPTAYYAWSGVEQQTGSTQIARAIGLLYALTGSFDAPGGNVMFPSVPSGDVVGAGLPLSVDRARALPVAERPLGPGTMEHITSDELYRAILDREPYAVRGLVGFGANVLLSHADSVRGRAALAALDFYVHADLFMNPTAELADVVLPVASAFEREGLKIGFDVSAEAQSLVQLRPAVVAPRGEARSDTAIVFDLAERLGFGEQFWGGDIEAATRQQLGPTGLTLEELRAQPGGIRVPLETRYRKYAETQDGVPRGFPTPTGKVEIYSERLLEHGYPALPEYHEPLVSPRSRPDLAPEYPLVLTCSKRTQFCESQHRALPSLRRRVPFPEVEIHPSAATARGIRAGDWVTIASPNGAMRARARLNDALHPEVVCGEHGWWQACPELGAPAYDPFSRDGANYNQVIGSGAIDPVSGSVPLRAYVCQVSLADGPPAVQKTAPDGA